MAQPQAFSLDELKTRMQKSITSLRDELAGLRTGRATPSLLEPVTVEAYGSRVPLNQVATVTVPESRMLSVQVCHPQFWPRVEPRRRRRRHPRAAARTERRAPP